jgi:DNA-directed RNA polymerase subunit RPC12/RpoP
MRSYKCSRCGEDVKTKMAMGRKGVKLKCRNNHIFFANKDTPFELRKISPSAVNCPHSDKPSKGLGMCGACYNRHKMATDPEYKENVRKYQKTYIQKNFVKVYLTRSKYDIKKLPLGAKKKLLNWLFALIQEEKGAI